MSSGVAIITGMNKELDLNADQEARDLMPADLSPSKPLPAHPTKYPQPSPGGIDYELWLAARWEAED